MGSAELLNVDLRRGWHIIGGSKLKEVHVLYCNYVCGLQEAGRLRRRLGLERLFVTDVGGMSTLVDTEEVRVDTVGVSQCGELTSRCMQA